LKVSLTDSMIWRSGLTKPAPGRPGSPLRAEPGLGEDDFEVVPVVVLFADQRLAGQLGVVEDGQQRLLLVGLGVGQCEPDR
jgi:hypothetical protein